MKHWFVHFAESQSRRAQHQVFSDKTNKTEISKIKNLWQNSTSAPERVCSGPFTTRTASTWTLERSVSDCNNTHTHISPRYFIKH